MVPAFYYAEFSRQFRLWKRERSSSYVTDDKDENGRKGRVIKKRNYFKQLLNPSTRLLCSWLEICPVWILAVMLVCLLFALGLVVGLDLLQELVGFDVAVCGGLPNDGEEDHSDDAEGDGHLED